jgi:stage V sporulation protein AD
MMLAAMTVNAGYADVAAAVTSSHNCSAERQYRTPIEYGGQKPPTAQWTVTGAGAFIIDGRDPGNAMARITAVQPGIVVDGGVTDANNMGAAMAPAAADSICRYFASTGESPDDFDLVLTGDLGEVGSEMLKDLLSAEGVDISSVHNDCGKMIYHGIERPDVNSGGSGCGCAASVMAAHILPRLQRGELRRVLFLATGAMMSPSSIQQGLSIPAVAHALVLESPE